MIEDMEFQSLPPLLPGERIEWQGRPDAGLFFRPIELFLIPFSLFWGGFAILWNISAWTSRADPSFALFGLPFLVIGVYLIFGRFLADSIIRKRLRYFVTNKRILIDKSGRSALRSLDIGRLPALEFDEKSDGSGSIRFGSARSLLWTNNFGIWQPSLDQTPQFLRISNVRSVFELIQRLAHR